MSFIFCTLCERTNVLFERSSCKRTHPHSHFFENRHIWQVGLRVCDEALYTSCHTEKYESAHTREPWCMTTKLASLHSYLPYKLPYFDVENKKAASWASPAWVLSRLQTKRTIWLQSPSFVSRQSFLRFDYITICIIANRPFYCPLFALQLHAQSHKTLGRGTLIPEMKSVHTPVTKVCLYTKVFADLHGAFKYTLLFNHYCLCRHCAASLRNTHNFFLCRQMQTMRG